MIAALLLALVPLVGDDLSALDKKLHSSDDRERMAAVTELARVGSKEAWSRVLDALKDPSSMVGDEAELQLGKLDQPDLVDELCGRRGLLSGDERVQLRAAGALAGLESVELQAAKLQGPLAAKSVAVRRTLRASIERLLGRNRIQASDRLAGAL